MFGEKYKLLKAFKNMRIKIALHTQNTIQNILKPQIQTDKYNRSDIYQIKCLEFSLNYIGQTGRTFSIRYKEHIYAIRNDNSNSGYSNQWYT
jgi:hypothetical protein